MADFEGLDGGADGNIGKRNGADGGDFPAIYRAKEWKNAIRNIGREAAADAGGGNMKTYTQEDFSNGVIDLGDPCAFAILW